MSLKVVAYCAIALAMASCVSKEPDTDLSPVPDSILTSISVNRIPALAGFDMMWENLDEIALRCHKDEESVPSSSIYTTSLAAPKATAVFKKSIGSADYPDKIDGKYVAVYPASSDCIEWGREPYVMLAPNSVQTVKNKKIDRSSSIMFAVSDTSEFTFRHVVSYVKFKVSSETSAFNKVTIVSGDPSQYMVSRIKVDFDDSFSYELVPVDASGNEYGQSDHKVSLSTHDQTSFAPGTYLIAINPDIYSEGLVLTFEDRPGSTATAVYEGPFDLKPGEVIDLGDIGTLDFEVSSVFYPQTEVGTILKGKSCEKIVDVIWDTTYNVVNGLDYYKMRVQTDSDEKIDIYLLRADMSESLDLKVAISSETTPTEWMTQTLSLMAEHMDSRTKPLYAMINADFCDNRSPIRPRGPVHCDGEVLCPDYSLDPAYTQQGLSYIGVTNDGKVSIGTRNEYEYEKSSLKECTGAGVILVQNSRMLHGNLQEIPGQASDILLTIKYGCWLQMEGIKGLKE